jgi:hypothetical protein
MSKGGIASLSHFYKIDRIHYFDLRHSLFDIRYSLFQSFFFDLTGRFLGQRRRLTLLALRSLKGEAGNLEPLSVLFALGTDRIYLLDILSGTIFYPKPKPGNRKYSLICLHSTFVTGAYHVQT